jgi:hypothetical protein
LSRQEKWYPNTLTRADKVEEEGGEATLKVVQWQARWEERMQKSRVTSHEPHEVHED